MACGGKNDCHSTAREPVFLGTGEGMSERRFTHNGQQALVRAYQAAREMGHAAIEPEHLLLGALGEECGLVKEWRSLEKQVGAAVCRRLGKGTQSPTALSERSAEVIEQASVMATAGGAITARGLLCVLLTQPGCLEVLASCGVEGEALRRRLQPKTGVRSTRRELKLTMQFGEDMTARAQAGDFDPVACREREIDRVMQILCRRQKSNPVLLGPAGVGKTAVVEGLAQRIVSGQVPAALLGRRVVSLSLAGMVAGTKYRGEFEEKVRSMLQEVRAAGDTILFIDELHTICGAGSAEGAIDAGNLLKPALARGGLQVIGATTGGEFKKYISRDSALARRFQPVEVRETDRNDTDTILRALRPRYESHHGVTISDGALEAVLQLAPACMPGRADPDRSVDLMDEAAARAAMEQSGRVTAEHVEQVARILCGEGRESTLQSRRRLLGLEEHLKSRVLGQTEAVEQVARAMLRRAAFPGAGRPRGCFLFCGPSGVGKTSLAKALAEHLCPGPDGLIRLDMSEYLEKHSVSRLIGSPPGYVGYGEGGQLTERVRARPASVVLLDEVEKAHPDVLNVLLQMLEEGQLTDGTGQTVSFRETVVILTSNLGSEITGGKPCGFVRPGQAQLDRERVLAAVKKALRPELLARLDGVMLFQPLGQDSMAGILCRELEVLSEKCRKQGLELRWDRGVLQAILAQNREAQMGARALRQMVERQVEDPLAAAILAGVAGKRITITADGGEIKVLWHAAAAV